MDWNTTVFLVFGLLGWRPVTPSGSERRPPQDRPARLTPKARNILMQIHDQYMHSGTHVGSRAGLASPRLASQFEGWLALELM